MRRTNPTSRSAQRLFYLLAIAVVCAAALPALLPPHPGASGAASADGPAGPFPAGGTLTDTAANGRGSVPLPPGAKDLLPHIANVPAERVQGPVDTCWVWAATAIAEVALDVLVRVRDRLSIGYFDATYRGGTGTGWAGERGWIDDFAAQLDRNPILVPWSNANASYRDGTRSCARECRAAVEASTIATESQYRVTRSESRRIPTWRVGESAAVANIRAELDADRAVFVGITLPNATARKAFQEFWANGAETDPRDPSPWLSARDEGDAFSHAVACVGYDATDPASPYWVILNSWGTADGRRPDGTFRMRMDLDYDLPVYRSHPGAPATAFEALEIAFADPAPAPGAPA